jgi:serine-type D-Ala-D-Ala carboxypeptidase (penicillin-binding protein 5/6)
MRPIAHARVERAWVRAAPPRDCFQAPAAARSDEGRGEGATQVRDVIGIGSGRVRRAQALWLVVCGVAWVALALGASHAALAQGFQTLAPHAILIDADSRSVLFEKAADDPFAPASLAKLMTIEIVFHEIREGRLTLDTEILITEDAWRRGGAGGGGSSMFAQVNSRVKLSDILRGLIVQSGNDAAIAVGEALGGTEENFGRMMTARAREIGLTRSTFRNATGYSAPDQRVTARDLAKLALHLIETYPDLYPIFAEREFTWNKIRQQNRNPLLGMEVGADGLKTGYLEESGYGLVGSAVQNGQRLVLVVGGLKTARDRSAESRKLLDWGYRSFEARPIFAADEPAAQASVFGGAESTVPLVARKPVRLLVPRGSGERLSARVVYRGPLRAPVERGQAVGRLLVTRGEVQVLDLPLYTGADVAVGTLTQRAVDGLLEMGLGTVRRAFDRSAKSS